MNLKDYLKDKYLRDIKNINNQVFLYLNKHGTIKDITKNIDFFDISNNKNLLVMDVIKKDDYLEVWLGGLEDVGL